MCTTCICDCGGKSESAEDTVDKDPVGGHDCSEGLYSLAESILKRHSSRRAEVVENVDEDGEEEEEEETESATRVREREEDE